MAAANESDYVDDALELLVNQFADPLSFVRELVQNSIDAGSAEVEVSCSLQPDAGGEHGTMVIRVDDFGDGMDRAIIDNRLTRLFASDKEDDLTKIGKFGIGFVSVFALQPDAVCLDTGRLGESWRVLFRKDRTFTRIDQSIAMAALFTAVHMKVKAIAALTDSGSTALWMSRINCGVPIYALTPDADAVARTPDGQLAMHAVATLAVDSGPAEIARYDRLRNVNFEIELNGVPLGEVEKAALELPSLKKLPPGVIQTSVGDAEAMAELFESFGLAMATGVLCIYVVLVLLFKDFVQPATILAALVLSIPGAFLALFVTQSSLSMPSMIGLIMLMGIATKNSILLIDYVVLARREHGLNRWEALLDACRKRARPIVMTTIAMGAGMTPIALGLGVDPSFRAPMAIVVIGGLITSTFLSLLVIPVVFTFVDDLVQWVGRHAHRRRHAAGSLPATIAE